MATRNISPRADGEGSLGRSGKKWGNIYADNAHIAGRDIAEDGAKLDANSSAIDSLRNAVGSPLVANSVGAMTDTDKIYVYTGNETGYTKGDWYYWNGTAWVSGGVYNSTAFETDKTLIVSGAAADAQVTGDWLRDIAVPTVGNAAEPGPCDEFVQYIQDKDNRLLFGIRRDGSVTWQKGVPAPVLNAISPTIDNAEYAYVILDQDQHLLFAIKSDGSVTWQKGTPQHVIDACNPSFENPEYLYLIKDRNNRIVFGIKNDGSVNWSKGIPSHLVDFIDKKFMLNKSPISKKRWAAMGDSLTDKNAIPGYKMYYEYVEESTGVIALDYGIGGTGYKRFDDQGLAFYQRVQNLNADDFDVLTIFGSGNDHFYTLGSVSDTTSNTVFGCVNLTIEAYFDVAISKPIGLVTPCPWESYPTYEANNWMDEYSNGIVTIAKKYGIPYMDLYHESGMYPWINSFKTMFYSGDSIHPNSLGHKIFLAPKFREFILKLL